LKFPENLRTLFQALAKTNKKANIAFDSNPKAETVLSVIGKNITKKHQQYKPRV